MTGIVMTGLWYAAGQTVSAVIAGLDCGDYVVAANGTIIVPYQSDPDGLLTPAFLVNQSNSAPSAAGWPHMSTLTVTNGGVATQVSVPVSIGYAFFSQGQIVRPVQQAESHTERGPSMGETRRLHQFAALFVNGMGVYVGGSTDAADLYQIVFRNPDGTRLLKSAGYTGLYWETLGGDYGLDGMLFWQVVRPVPCTVVSLTGFMETAER